MLKEAVLRLYREHFHYPINSILMDTIKIFILFNILFYITLHKDNASKQLYTLTWMNEWMNHHHEE